jgi:hypothetical protein
MLLNDHDVGAPQLRQMVSGIRACDTTADDCRSAVGRKRDSDLWVVSANKGTANLTLGSAQILNDMALRGSDRVWTHLETQVLSSKKWTSSFSLSARCERQTCRDNVRCVHTSREDLPGPQERVLRTRL